MSPLKVVFLGTPEFAVPTLEALVAAAAPLPHGRGSETASPALPSRDPDIPFRGAGREGADVLEVITQPDRPRGRKRELIPSPVKAAALRHGIPVYQPERIRRPEAIEHLRALGPDVMIVVGYGQIIPQSVIDIAPLGIINVHASLLPELRGAAPIQWSIVRGYERTGVTTMRIDAGLDTGDTLDQWDTPIGPDETAPELSERLAAAGARLLMQTLAELAAGTAHPVPQDDARATLAPILKKEDGRIDWHCSAHQIHNRIRGFQPWPGAHTLFRGQSLHLWRSRLVPQRWNLGPGALVQGEGVFAVGGDGASLELLEVQLEGRKKMPAAVFAHGHRLTPEDRLGI